MASTDAKPIPLKNTAYRVYFVLLDADGDPVASATFDSGLSSGANKALVSKDAAASVNSTNNVTAIDNGMYYLDLSSGEMNYDNVSLMFRTTTAGAKNTFVSLYPLEDGDVAVNVTQWRGTQPNTLQSGRVDGYTGAMAAGVVTASAIADAAIDAATFAAGAIDAAAIANGAIDAATFAAGAIDASAIAADAIGSSEFAQAAADKVWLSASRTLTAFSTALAVSVWDVLTAAIATASSIGLQVKTNLDATISSRSTYAGGAVASVTGDVGGNVVGNVNGNVVGSVGSVAGAVASVTGNVGGNVVGTVGSVVGGVGGDVSGKVLGGGVSALTGTGVRAVDASGNNIAPASATTDIQARLPAALVGGRIDASVGAMANDVVTAAALATDAADEIADHVWDETLADHLGAGSTGNALNAAGAAGDPWTTAIPGAYGVGTAGYIVGNNLDASVADVETDTQNIQSRLPAALVGGKIDANVGSLDANVITSAVIATDAIGADELAQAAADKVWNTVVRTITGGSVGTVTGNVDGNVGGNVTGSVGSVAAAVDVGTIAANAIDAASLAVDAGTEIADAILARDLSAVAGAASRSLLNAARKLVNRVGFAAGTLTVYQEDDATPAITQAVTTDAAQEPFKELDTA